MPKYVKNQIEVEAELFHEDTFRKSEFLKRAVQDRANPGQNRKDTSELWVDAKAEDGRYYLSTPERAHHFLDNGVYVIKGDGGYYPCKADVFATNYTEAGKSEYVSITKEEYDHLLDRAEFLSCLQGSGVDNWSGYGDAMESYHSGEEE